MNVTPSQTGSCAGASSESALSLALRYGDDLAGQLRCFDRVILQGTLVDIAHPGALAVQMHAAGLTPCELVRFAQPFNDQVRDNAILLGRQHGVEVEYIQKKNFRQEDRIAEILKRRGSHPGLVHIFSAKESGTVFETRKNKQSGHVRLVARRGACLHYYFYWMHEQLGLIYVRVQTWLPLRLQVYFNGHFWLARQLDQAGIAYQMADNAMVSCSDWSRTQKLADGLDARILHQQLKSLAELCCPAALRFSNGYHWSFMQVEYAQDLVFKDSERASRLFDELAREAILTIRADDVARFLGRKVPRQYDTPLNSHLGGRQEGLRLKHSLGPASVKLYNKPGGVLRLEGTTYDVSFFKHYRKVVHRDGTQEGKVAPLKKSLYGLRDVSGVMGAAVERYAQWLAALTERSSGRADLEKVGKPARDEAGRSYRGFNLFLATDLAAILAVLRGEFATCGLSVRRLYDQLPNWTSNQISRLLKRLRLHGMLKKKGHSYTYYLTELGRRVMLTLLRLREHLVVPAITPKTS